ncbi:MAG: GFA family protein [Acetobacterales bacterium]
MHLEGSCHCGAVRFTVQAYAPVPFMRCYCSICRKTAGGGGYAINLGARADTLEVDGAGDITMFHAMVDGRESSGERRFCCRCGSALWVSDPAWPDLVHPFASAIDTPLPEPPDRVHMLLDSKADWVQPDLRDGDSQHEGYPPDSLEEWHRARGLLSED